MRKSLHTAFILLFLCASFSSCSSDQEKKEKGTIEQGTDKVAHEAVQAIKTPLDQAKLAAEQENNQAKQINEQVKKQ